jgi:hypothetical protein
MRSSITDAQTGVLNYVVVRPITAVFGFALTPFGLYKSGNVDPRNARSPNTNRRNRRWLAHSTHAPRSPHDARTPTPPQAYIYLATINSVSQGWALYCLIMLYRATSSDLAGVKVLAKFLCVKGVVFFTFWQGLAVALGIRAGAIQHLIKPHGHDSEADLATRLQNFITW